MPFKAIVASSSVSAKHASLKSKRPYASTTKLVKKRIPRSKISTSESVVVSKKGGPKSLIQLLPKALVEIVIAYFRDESDYEKDDKAGYITNVSSHDWRLGYTPKIGVDRARLYTMTHSLGLKSLNHPLANLKENDRRCNQFGDPEWFNYSDFSSSHDGRYIAFSYNYNDASTGRKRTEYATKWLVQNMLEDGKLDYVTFDGEDSYWGLLSRDGQMLFSYNKLMRPATRVYQIMEERGKGPVAFMKRVFNGEPRAVSGDGKRVMMSNGKQLEIHDIGKDASKLVCQISASGNACALNENGSEAAFFSAGELRIVDVDKVAGDKVDQPAIVSVKVPDSSNGIVKLVYSDRKKLHVLHKGGKVSLFDPSTKEFIVLEAPQEGHDIIDWAISPDADYIVTLERVLEKDDTSYFFRTIVKHKRSSADWEYLFEYVADKVSGRRPSPAEEQQ